MTTFQAIVLGAVQGVTEFLPISSSAHLYLVPWFFKWKDPGLTYDVFLHVGTFLALAGYFFRDWMAILRAGFMSIIERRIGFDRERLLFWLMVIGTIPGCLAGLMFDDMAENAFRSPLLMAVTLSSVGLLIYWVDGKYSALRSVEELRFQDAMWIGLAQAFAIIPGVSRSGSTMAMGRIRGLNREAAARFSFLLSLPITFAAVVFKCKKFAEETATIVPSAALIGGFLASLIFGVISIHFLLQYVRSANFKIFAWYRLLLAVAILAYTLLSPA